MSKKLRSRYGLTKAPFTKEVPTDELYLHPQAEQAVELLRATIEGRSSAAVTGESGTGNTFTFRALGAQLPTGAFRITYIHNSTVNLRDFYRQLGQALGIEPKATPSALFHKITSQIEDIAQQKTRPVLVIDEAHLLLVEVLGHLHILMNYHRDSKSLLSLLLLGSPPCVTGWPGTRSPRSRPGSRSGSTSSPSRRRRSASTCVTACAPPAAARTSSQRTPCS